MVMVACPNISERTLALTFLDTSKVAHVVLRSSKRICGKPVRSSRGLKRCAVTYWRTKRLVDLRGEYESSYSSSFSEQGIEDGIS
jgi:hypothetical protein